MRSWFGFKINQLTSFAFKISAVLGTLLCIGGVPLQAAEVVLKMSNGVMASADYRQGEAGNPAILILHGFLQTYHFSTVTRLADELNGSGYTILAPTLTLNVDKRRASLTCDAIQSHHFGDHQEEMDAWLSWLENSGHKKVILVGHSIGSTRLVSYMSGLNGKQVIGLIATSLSVPQNAINQETMGVAIERARKMLGGGPGSVGRFSLSYCRGNYVAPPQAYLSYSELTVERVFEMASAVTVPIKIIFGSDDRFIPQSWIQLLQTKGFDVSVIEGANHFFNQQHEFEFQDEVLAAIEAITGS